MSHPAPSLPEQSEPRAVRATSGSVQGDVEGGTGAHRRQLQRWDEDLSLIHISEPTRPEPI
eukprot:8491664-Pyramimonas_sp.AAC.1